MAEVVTACVKGPPARTIRIPNDTSFSVILQERWRFTPRKLDQAKLAAGATLRTSQASDLIAFSSSDDGAMVEVLRNVMDDAAEDVGCLSVVFPRRREHELDVPVDAKISLAVTGPYPQRTYGSPVHADAATVTAAFAPHSRTAPPRGYSFGTANDAKKGPARRAFEAGSSTSHCCSGLTGSVC